MVNRKIIIDGPNECPACIMGHVPKETYFIPTKDGKHMVEVDATIINTVVKKLGITSSFGLELKLEGINDKS